MRRPLDFLGLQVQGLATIAQTLARSGGLLSTRERVALLIAAWTVGAFLTAFPHVRRFGGGLRDWAWIGAAIAVLMGLPLVPLLWLHSTADRYLVDLIAIAGLLIGLIISSSLRTQGRYAYTDRELPELEGAPREAAAEVLAMAGLEPVSIRSAPLLTFNALVQGFKKCTVIVDRRAAEAFPPRELAALIAHEAGHIRHGGILPYLAAFTLVLTAASVVRACGLGDHLIVLHFVATLLLARVIVSQWLEFRCDRFAAKLTSAPELATALRRVHGDMPRGVARVLESFLSVPVSTHPPLRTRLAKLDAGKGSDVMRYRVVLWAAALGLCLFPVVFHCLPPAWRPKVPLELAIAAHCGPALYLAGWFLYCLALSFAGRKLGWAPLGAKSSLRWLLWATAAAWMVLVCVLASTQTPGHGTLKAVLILVSFALALLVTIASLLLGAFRFGTPLYSRRLRRALAEVNAALADGKPAEALALVDAGLMRMPHASWLHYQRGQCLLCLGRLDEAASSMEAPREDSTTLTAALCLLGVIELFRGELASAEKHTRAALEASPDNAFAWMLLGNIALDAGRHEEADRHLARSCELEERNSTALALRVMATLERGKPPAAVGAWMEKALASDPRLPAVLCATARVSVARGELDRARRQLQEAFAELHSRGWIGSIPYYERHGRRWGLLEDPLSTVGAGE